MIAPIALPPLAFLGTTEIIVLLVIALLIFGSSQLPKLARNMGRGIREFKDGIADMKNEITSDSSDKKSEKSDSNHIESKS